MTAASSVDDRELLASYVRQRRDREIDDAASIGDVSQILTMVFAGMQRRFVPANAPKKEVVVQWDVAGPDGRVHRWQTVVRPDGCIATTGTPRPPKVTLELSLPTFLRLVSGTLGTLRALGTRRLKVRGSPFAAASIERWFGG
ncbi:MAG: SCP2 sterol-binding domain-containing protein [Acidimicrobiales bacterium]